MTDMRNVLLAVLIFVGVTSLAGTWRPYERNPVLGNAKLGTCFDVNVVTDGPAPYTMYFSWRPRKAIALVRSEDGFVWTQEPEICLAADPTSGWEDDLNRSCTVRKDGVWHMWYTGQANGGSKIGYATSKDGVHFTRVRREPVMVPERDYEKLSVMNPYVRWDAKRNVWRMWYAAGETYEPNVLCYAESKDGLSWTKWGTNPIFGHGEGIVWDRDRVGACEVHPLPDGRWAMFYIGYSDIDTARIGCAISPDGITGWKRLAQNPIVAPDLGTWNGSACYKPSVVRDGKNDRWLLWYNGRNGAPEYVGMAVHAGLDLEAPSPKLPDTTALLSSYVRRFNEKDEELYTNAIPNSAAEGFLLANAPRFACPDKDIERTYYFRWWTFRKHLKKGEKGGWRVTEFLPKVGWSGKDNTIVCPAGHHLREGRWLRDPRIIEDDARFWLSDPEATHRWTYSSWLFTGTRLFAEVAGRDGLSRELLDAAVRYYRRWEEGFTRGKLPMGGDGKGGFLSIDNYEGTEISLGGNGYKPLMSSAMWSEANAIADVARAAGRTELADEFAAKAAKILESLLANCWNEDVGFFTTAKTDGTKGTVRELHGYAPWYFGVPTGKTADWPQLADPQGFAARYGLTFPERRAAGFTIDYRGHECKWNGPSWPFATSIALTALANNLHSTPNAYTSLFASLLWQYADAQRLTHPTRQNGGDWEVVPWIDENLHPDKAEWLARKIILDTPSMRESFPKERGKDYNHSTFCDLVISGLVGFLPNGAEGFTVDPLFPATWDYLVLENLRYRGHDVDIRWQRGKGLAVSVDGQEVARSASLGRIVVELVALPSSGKVYKNPIALPDTPDPTVWAGGDGWHYAASTRQRILRSRDLVSWEDTGRLLLEQETYDSAKRENYEIWAPDVVRVGNKWNLYVAYWNTMNDSKILAFSADSPTGPFTDGVVLTHSRDTGIVDTIDPEVVLDETTGRLWLFFGSVGKIHRIELAADGLSLAKDARYVHVAGLRYDDRNAGPHRRRVFEGAYLHERSGWWYLFASSGEYSNGTYAVVVGRSRSLTGTFVDRSGRRMQDGYAETILSTREDDAFFGPGHNGEIFTTPSGKTYMFYHCHWRGCRDMSFRPMCLQEVFWSEDGWPFFANGGYPQGNCELR